jgi:hypothetical protein
MGKSAGPGGFARALRHDRKSNRKQSKNTNENTIIPKIKASQTLTG